jgi:hypothetical protein
MNPPLTNWVERRSKVERAVGEQADRVWNDIRAAIQDACASFERLYPDQPIEVFLENGHRVRVSRSITFNRMTREQPHGLGILVYRDNRPDHIVVVRAAIA